MPSSSFLSTAVCKHSAVSLAHAVDADVFYTLNDACLLHCCCWRCFFTTRRLQQPNRSCARSSTSTAESTRQHKLSVHAAAAASCEREWRSFKIKLNWLFHKRASSSASHISPFFPSHSRLVSLTRAYSHINTFSSSATDPRAFEPRTERRSNKCGKKEKHTLTSTLKYMKKELFLMSNGELENWKLGKYTIAIVGTRREGLVFQLRVAFAYILRFHSL